MQTRPGWLDARELAKVAAVPDRTARHHLRRFADLGVVEVAKLFPAYLYRRSEHVADGARAYAAQLEYAAAALPKTG